MNLFPKGERHRFLYRLSYLILLPYSVVPSAVKSHPPLPGANLLTPVLLWVGPPIHNCIWRIAMGLWGHPESEQSHQKQVHAGAVILYDPLGKCLLSVRLVCSTIPELWGLYAICNFHLIFRALHTYWIKSATKAVLLSDSILVVNPNLGIISRSRQWATSLAFSVRVGKPSTHLESVHNLTSK